MEGLNDSVLIWIILGFLSQFIWLIPAILTLVASFLARKHYSGVGSNLMMIGASLFLFLTTFDLYFNNWLLPKMMRNDNLDVILYGKAALWFIISTLFALGLLLFVKQMTREGNRIKADNFL